jgi:hypothetical protein
LRNIKLKIFNKLNKLKQVIIWIYWLSCHLHPSYIACGGERGRYVGTANWIWNNFIYQRASCLYHIHFHKHVSMGVREFVCVWVDVHVGVDIHACGYMYLHMCVRLCMCARAHDV